MTLFSSLWSEANGTNTPLFGALWAGVSDTGVEALEPLFANGELGGYWPADPAYAYEDSAGTTLASVGGVVGYRTDVALGKHAVQATTANKPYLRVTPTTNKPWYDSNTATGALTATFSGALGSACTLATVTPEGVSIIENQTVGTTYNITPPYGYNSDVLIINRALTAAEKALVTRVMVRDVPGLVNELQVIQSIFVHGGVGGWYSRADFSKLLTAYNGTTAVTAINDAIGRNEPAAGTIAALNATSTQRPLLKQLATGQYHLYHDRVDDKLTLASMPAGDYTIAFASFAGVSVYPIKLNATETLSLPAIDATEMLVINRALTDSETSSVRSILATKAPTIGATDILRLYSSTNSVNLAITETGGDSGATWELGDGQTASGTSCVKTVAAPQSVVLRATTPDKITTIDWNTKNLFGQIVDLSKLTALTYFYCNANQLTGSIPSLTTNTALIYFDCGSNQLTGSIPSLTTNTALIYFYCYINHLTGSIPSLTTNTALIDFHCGSNQLTGSIPSLTTNTALVYFTCYSNQLTGSIPSLTTNTALIYFNCGSNQLTGSIPSLTTNTALIYFYCYNNQLTDFAGGTVSNTLGDFQAQNNLLTETAVNAILAAFVAANRTTGTRVLNLGGTGNAAPTGQGITDKATLQSRGWTVTTN